jgi:hypothetical protein
MAFEVEGKLHKIFPTESKSASFQAREFVLEVPDGNYPQMIKFQAVQDRCTMLDGYQEGDRVKVSFDLRGREWNGKYLTNLNAWRMEKAGESGSAKPQADQRFPEDPFPNYNEAPPAPTTGGNLDDLPF